MRTSDIAYFFTQTARTQPHKPMKKEYDFTKGKRGPVVRMPPDKLRAMIRLDKGILNWFRQQVDLAGGGNYQTLINDALRKLVERT